MLMQNHNDDNEDKRHGSFKKYTSHLSERVVCEKELETEQNCNILTPTLRAISVSFQFSWAAQPGAWFSLPHLISNSSDLQNLLNFLCPELYNSSTATQSLPITGHRNMYFCRLWNGMFDCHRAEITFMQFTGHSLPVY